jgi:hypothetical protein
MCLSTGDWIQLSVAIGTIAMAIATFITISISQKQHKQTLKEMQEQRKPILKICHIQYPQYSRDGTLTNHYWLSVKNVGFGPAEKIEIYARGSSEIVPREQGELYFEISALGKDEAEKITDLDEICCNVLKYRRDDQNFEFALRLTISKKYDSYWKTEVYAHKGANEFKFIYIHKIITKEEYEKFGETKVN